MEKCREISFIGHKMIKLLSEIAFKLSSVYKLQRAEWHWLVLGLGLLCVQMEQA